MPRLLGCLVDNSAHDVAGEIADILRRSSSVNIYVVYHESAGYMIWEGLPHKEDLKQEFAEEIKSYQEDEEFNVEEFLDEFKYL